MRLLSVFVLLTGLTGLFCDTGGKGKSAMKSANTLNLSNLELSLNAYIKNTNKTISVAFQDVNQNFYLGINDTISLHAASTMKVPVMMEVYRQAESGRFAMDDLILVKNEFRSIVDSSSYSLDIKEDGGDRLYSMIGHKESIRSLVNEMITYSGNLATNLLIEYVGAINVQELMMSFGATDIQVLRGVEDIKAYRAGKNNTTTAKDLALIFQEIYKGTYWDKNSREEMINILLDQKYRTKIPAKLPKQVKVAHKTGSITQIDHDSGIIFPENHVPYILVVLTKGFEDHGEAQECIADISLMIYDWYVN